VLGVTYSISQMLSIAKVLVMVCMLLPSSLMVVTGAEPSFFCRLKCASTKGGSGAIKEYTDSLSQLSKGTNGAWRIKEALAVVELNMKDSIGKVVLSKHPMDYFIARRYLNAKGTSEESVAKQKVEECAMKVVVGDPRPGARLQTSFKFTTGKQPSETAIQMSGTVDSAESVKKLLLIKKGLNADELAALRQEYDVVDADGYADYENGILTNAGVDATKAVFDVKIVSYDGYSEFDSVPIFEKRELESVMAKISTGGGGGISELTHYTSKLDGIVSHDLLAEVYPSKYWLSFLSFRIRITADFEDINKDEVTIPILVEGDAALDVTFRRAYKGKRVLLSEPLVKIRGDYPSLRQALKDQGFKLFGGEPGAMVKIDDAKYKDFEKKRWLADLFDLALFGHSRGTDLLVDRMHMLVSCADGRLSSYPVSAIELKADPINKPNGFNPNGAYRPIDKTVIATIGASELQLEERYHTENAGWKAAIGFTKPDTAPGKWGPWDPTTQPFKPLNKKNLGQAVVDGKMVVVHCHGGFVTGGAVVLTGSPDSLLLLKSDLSLDNVAARDELLDSTRWLSPTDFNHIRPKGLLLAACNGKPFYDGIVPQIPAPVAYIDSPDGKRPAQVALSTMLNFDDGVPEARRHQVAYAFNRIMYGVPFQLRWTGTGVPGSGQSIQLIAYGEAAEAAYAKDLNRPTVNGPVTAEYDPEIGGYKFEWNDVYVPTDMNRLTVIFTGAVHQGNGRTIFKVSIKDKSHGFVTPYEFWLSKVAADALPCIVFGDPNAAGWNTVAVNQLGMTSLAHFAETWQANFDAHRLEHGLKNAYWDVALGNLYDNFATVYPWKSPLSDDN
jgi:hypothetical protein